MVEIGSADFGAVRGALAGVPEVRSVAQLGNRLRVLLPKGVGDAVGRLREAVAAVTPGATIEPAEASLEDVFVAATRLRDGAARRERAA